MNFTPSVHSDLSGAHGVVKDMLAKAKEAQEAAIKEKAGITDTESEPAPVWPWVVGGAVVLGALGTAVYFATRK